MLRPGALVAVRQQQRQPAQPAPLGLPRGNELVDHHLGAVGEVPELRLPNDQFMRRGGGVAVFEGQHRLLRKQGVVDVEIGGFGNFVERYEALAAALVVQAGVAVGEGPHPHILAGQAHPVPGVNQGGVSHGLGVAPVHRAFAGGHCVPFGQGLGHLPLQLEAVGHAGQPPGQFDEAVLGKPGVRRRGPLVAQERAPVHKQAVVRLLDDGQGHMTAPLQGAAVLLRHVRRLGGGDDLLADQLLDIQIPSGRQLAYLGVHQGLRLHRLLGLVVPPAAVADDVYDQILAEPHAVVRRQPRREDHGLGIIAVDMQDGRLHHLGDLGAVLGGAGVVLAAGGEADLVVEDDVDRAAGLEAAGLGHLEGLHDHALAGEGGVAVDQDGGHQVPAVVPPAVLAGAHRALHHRPDDFQMGRIEGQRQVHLPAWGHDVGGEALMVLDIAGAHLGGHLAVKLVKQVPRVLAQNVDQHVQAPAVGHADHGLQHSLGAEPLQQFVQAGNQGLAALQPKPLDARIAAMQVLLQPLGGGQPLQDGSLVRRRQPPVGALHLQAGLHPELLRGLGQMHVLGAHAAAIEHLQGGDDVLQFGGALPVVQEVRVEDLVEVGGGEIMVGQLQHRHGPPLHHAQGVDVRFFVPPRPIGGGQVEDAHLLAFMLVDDRGAFALRARLQAVAADAFKVGDDPAVRNFHLGGRRRRRQAVEIAAPLGGQALRRRQPSFVHGLDVGGVGAGQVGACPHALKVGVSHAAQTSSFPPAASTPRPRRPAAPAGRVSCRWPGSDSGPWGRR